MKKKVEAEVKVRGLEYVGDGTAWRCPGGLVPTRGLTAAEVERYGGEAAVMASGLYVKIEAEVKAEVEVEEDSDATE